MFNKLFQSEEKRKLEEARKAQEQHMSDVIDVVKEKLFPLMSSNNENVKTTKQFLESTAVVLNQALYSIMMRTNVSELGLEKEIADTKDTQKWKEMLQTLNDVPLNMAIESLQWLVSKIDAIIERENKDRLFNDLNIDLENPHDKAQA